mgnify:CR=1 FL=1|tara:strand:+ start:3720 stop:5744 length:2025 start_codon:yes stop_codon:yes gene_type:complete
MSIVKKNIDRLLILIFIIFLIIPISKHFPIHFEFYSNSFFTSKIFVEKNYNIFNFFLYELGPGTTLPLGQNTYIFPTSIFSSSYKSYAILNIILSFILQLYFLRRIISILDFEINLTLIFLCISSITFYWCIYLYDYVEIFLQFSLYFGVIFYLTKTIKKKSNISFYKFLLLISLNVLIFHLAHSFIIFAFIFIFYIFNFKKLNKIIKFKVILISLAIFILINGENIYYLLQTFLMTSDGNREIRHVYDIKHILSGMYIFIINLQEIFGLEIIDRKFDLIDNFFLPFYGFHIYLALYAAIFSIIKKYSQKILYFDWIFMISLSLSFIKINYLILDTPAFFRDLYSILALILCAFFFQLYKKKNLLISSIKFLMIFSLVIFYYTNQKLYKAESELYVDKKYSSDFTSLVNILSNSNTNQLDKVYLSPKIYQYFSHHKKKDKENFFFKNQVYDIVDFLDHEIYIFNYNFKNSHKSELKKSKLRMYSELLPDYSEINQNFFNLFNIRYLLIYETEKIKIDHEFLKIKQKIIHEDKIILVYEIKDKQLPLFVVKSNKEPCLNSDKYIRCIIDNDEYFKYNSKVEFQKITDEKYLIKNLNTFKVNYILPFLYDKNWKLKERMLSPRSLNNHLMYLELSPNTVYELYYDDNIRKILRSVSFLSLILLIFFIIYTSKNKKI